MLASTLVTVAAVCALLVFEWRGSRIGIWIAKPIAALGFVATALLAGALDTRYGSLVLVGLVFSFFGDVFLIPRGKATFAAGLVAFLLGHVAYTIAFLGRGPSLAVVAGAAALLVVPVVIVLRWLGPHVGEGLRTPVKLYVAVISAMLACAAGATAATGDRLILAGAFAFFVSDLAVARGQFVEKSFSNKAWGLPLYFGGQLLLAWSIVA